MEHYGALFERRSWKLVESLMMSCSPVTVSSFIFQIDEKLVEGFHLAKAFLPGSKKMLLNL